MPHLGHCKDCEALQCTSVPPGGRWRGRAVRGAAVQFLFLLLLAIATFPVAAGAAGNDAERDFVAAARAQVGVTRIYDAAYRRLAYPNGDVPAERGVCADVIVRAYRGIGIDLQRRLHEDMGTHFAAYPNHWGLKAPDANIDHRRVPNLATYFGRHGKTLSPSRRAADYRAGDVVVWRLSNGLAHIGLVVAADPVAPRVVHNIGAGAQEEAVLFDFTITGHYRYALP
jgi:hypothetical protein